MYYFYYAIANFSKVFTVWLILTFINQFVFFGACLRPDCILASIPHISVITAVVIAVLAKDDNEAREKAIILNKKANEKIESFFHFVGILLKWVTLVSILLIIIIAIYNKLTEDNSKISDSNYQASESVNENHYVDKESQIQYCLENFDSWRYSRYNNSIECYGAKKNSFDYLEQKSEKNTPVEIIPPPVIETDNIETMETEAIEVIDIEANLKKSMMKCTKCHGLFWEKHAKGQSKIVADMSKRNIEKALIGYKYGTYGTSLKGMMKRKVSKFTDKELKKIAEIIVNET